MQYTYKHLSSSDVRLMRDLNRVFGEAFDLAQMYQEGAPSDAYLRGLLSKPHIIVLVAMAGEEVVGGIVAYELDKFEQDRREVYIYDLAVAEPHRRRGIATGLIRALQRIAKERNAYVIFVQADLEDDPAIRLYESLGKREDVLHFDIPAKEQA